jgi:hypothetical protein
VREGVQAFGSAFHVTRRRRWWLRARARFFFLAGHAATMPRRPASQRPWQRGGGGGGDGDEQPLWQDDICSLLMHFVRADGEHGRWQVGQHGRWPARPVCVSSSGTPASSLQRTLLVLPALDASAGTPARRRIDPDGRDGLLTATKPTPTRGGPRRACRRLFKTGLMPVSVVCIDVLLMNPLCERFFGGSRRVTSCINAQRVGDVKRRPGGCC